MSNSFYNKTNAPSPNSPGSSAQIRNEFDLVYQAFNKMPVLSLANANKLVAINSTGNGLTQVNSLTGIGGIDNTPIGATTPSTGSFTNLLASGVVNLGLAVAIGGGTINNSIIGGVTPNAAYFTTAAASSGFTGNLTGNVTGNLTGNVAGNVTGNIASSGTSTFNNLTITGTLDMSSGTAGTITGLSAPTNASDAATKQYVDTADALKLNLAGGSMSGEIAMGGNRITGMANPSSAQDAATKTYVDTADALKLNLSGGALTGALAMSGNKITGLGTPTASTDAANKAYVDNAIQGLDAKASVRVASTANLNLTGTQTVDGVALVVGDRVLVKNQDTPAANGLYTVSSGTWTRTTDGDTWDELVAAYVFVEDGTTNGRNGFLCTITQGGTIGVTSISWVQFNSAGQIDAGNGLTKTGNRLDVATASADRIVVNPDNIDLAVTGISAGTYKSVTVDIYGRVVSGGNPNSLSGYGITDAYSKTEADLLYDAKLSRSGGTMTGAIAMGNNKITGLGTPTANSDAATKLYADGKLALTGGTMSGAIAMGSNKITGLADPTVAQDAVTLNYVTTLYGSTASAAASASAAATSEANALNYKNAAGVSASDAASSATAAAASYDAFDDRYLGSKTSDPTTDNDGNALIDGALYWNSTLGLMKAYKLATTSWILAYVPSDFYVAKSGDTITGNLTLSSGTANGVAYLNGSKVLTTGSALTFDGSQLNNSGIIYSGARFQSGSTDVLRVTNNAGSDALQIISRESGTDNIWFGNGGGGSSAPTAYLWMTRAGYEGMRLTSTGLGIGTSSPGYKLDVVGGGRFYSANYTDNVVRLATNSLTTGNINQILFADQLTNTTASITAYNTAYGSGLNGALRFATASGTATLDSSGNLGLGVTPSAWGSSYKALQTISGFFSSDGNGANYTTVMGNNAYFDSSDVRWEYYRTGNGASLYRQNNSTSGAAEHAWFTAPSGTAGNAITFTQAMTLDASGNLGIGTSSPASRLHIANAGDVNFRAQNTYFSTVGLLGADSSGAYAGSFTNHAFVMYTNSTERMRIHASGNVGIGSSGMYSPSGGGIAKLYIASDQDSQTSLVISNQLNGASASASLVLGSYGADWVLSSGSVAKNNTDFTISRGTTERMRIDSSGNLLVGTTGVPDGSTGGSALYASSYNRRILRLASNSTAAGMELAQFWNPNNQVGSIQTSGSSTSYSTSSDYRLKENIQPMQNALGVVAQLNPVRYTWKADGSDGQGFIAHELQAVVPDCVTGEKDAVDEEGNPVYQGIDTSFLVATLTKAIQEQQEQINQLTARVAQLEGQ